MDDILSKLKALIPQAPGVLKKPTTAPTGAQVSAGENDRFRDEAMRRAIAQVSGEMPDIAPELETMKPYQEGNLVDRLLFPKGAYAVTMPFSGRMMYDPETLPQEHQQMVDTLTHEGAHVRQMKGMTTAQKIQDILSSMMTPYAQRWQEKEAFAQEQRAHESRTRGDIRLK